VPPAGTSGTGSGGISQRPIRQYSPAPQSVLRKQSSESRQPAAPAMLAATAKTTLKPSAEERRKPS
jgi:hypothetical protein